MSKMKDETIQKMEAQRAKLDARIQLLKNKKNAEERKKDIRRKILAGVYLIHYMDANLQDLGKRMKDAGFLHERDLHLFNLDVEKTISS